MPCWQSRSTSVEFNPKNLTQLKQAVKALSWTMITEKSGIYTVITSEGRITIANGIATGNITNINQLRVAYSQAALQNGMQRAAGLGWAVKGSAATEVEFQVRGKA